MGGSDHAGEAFARQPTPAPTAAALPGGTLTFLFTDIEGSTRLWLRCPEAMQDALQGHDALLSQVIREQDGIVFKTVGDAFCAVFDNPTQALSAAHAAQLAIQARDWGPAPISVRMAVHTGVAECRADDYFGPPVNQVARLLSVAHGGQVLVSAATRALVQGRLPEGLALRDHGLHRLKDLPQAERIYQLAAPGLPLDFPPLMSLDIHPENLPVQLTSFVGRQQEIKDVGQLLATSRLLTLSGPPGTGKTRLAIQVARQNLARFQDGAFFVDLAPIDDPRLVLGAIARTLNLVEMAGQSLARTLTNYLREKELLLLLDNFEQVVAAAPEVCDLLAACPRLRLLVTSRQPLRVYGEQEYPLPPLAVPALDDGDDVQRLAQCEAVELFCHRARAVRPDFALTTHNAPYVSEICVRLDGLPLAIELAAARSKLLSPESMCARLESRFLTLTGGARDLPARMRTLQAAIDWSYDLLDADEQRLFDCLSIFQGGRTIHAVEVICADGPSYPVLDGLESLLNKNLLFAKEGRTGETRFHMLETIHEYARQRLAQRGQAAAMKARHARYFVALAERAETGIHGRRQAYWFATLADELDNLRAAFSWSLESASPEMAARLVAALRDFLYHKGLLSESTDWFQRVLAQDKSSLSTAVRARVLNAYSRIAFAGGEWLKGADLARQSLRLARQIDDEDTCAWGHLFTSICLMTAGGRIDEVLRHAEEGLRLSRALDNTRGIILGLNTLGELARQEGDYLRAADFYEECLALARQVGNRRREAISLANLAFVAYHQAEYEQAVERGKKALALVDALQAEHASAILVAIVAGPIGAGGQPHLAAQLLAAATEQLKVMGASFQPQDAFEIDRYTAAIRTQLGQSEFDKAWAEGQALSIEEALAMAVGSKAAGTSAAGSIAAGSIAAGT